MNDVQSNKHASELLDDLVREGIIQKNAEIEFYEQLHGGADTTIFEIGFKDITSTFVQRIFRPMVSDASAEFEYSVQKTLFENGINVPKTYFIKYAPNTYDRPYFVMDKIQGITITEAFQRNPNRFDELMDMFIRNLYMIHSIDPKLFPQVPTLDIQNNPFAVIDQSLRRPKREIASYPDDLKELSLLVDWLEKHKADNPCGELVVIHGDYHTFNLLIDRNENLQILDWTGINISDYRRDLGFSTVAMSAGAPENIAPLITTKYELLSGKKVKNLEYFMILSNVHNLMRLYSGLNNSAITNDNEATLAFFKNIKDYPLFLVNLVREECDIELKQIGDYFSN
ncbi:MAG: phosphotransferase family protein [Candidatus Thorarchaeota archaeon]